MSPPDSCWCRKLNSGSGRDTAAAIVAVFPKRMVGDGIQNQRGHRDLNSSAVARSTLGRVGSKSRGSNCASQTLDDYSSRRCRPSPIT